MGWIILIQYLLLVKLFLTTLLTAMFSHTKAKVDAESDQIVNFFYNYHYIRLNRGVNLNFLLNFFFHSLSGCFNATRS